VVRFLHGRISNDLSLGGEISIFNPRPFALATAYGRQPAEGHASVFQMTINQRSNVNKSAFFKSFVSRSFDILVRFAQFQLQDAGSFPACVLCNYASAFCVKPKTAAKFECITRVPRTVPGLSLHTRDPQQATGVLLFSNLRPDRMRLSGHIINCQVEVPFDVSK